MKNSRLNAEAESGTPQARFHNLQSTCPNGRVDLYAPTNSPEKLLQSNCPTSAENSGNFTAEVGKVLLCVFQTSCVEVVFSCFWVWNPLQRGANVFRKLHPTFCPIAAVEATVADGFGNVVALDSFAPFQVGNGACHLQDAAISTGTEFETFHSHA